MNEIEQIILSSIDRGLRKQIDISQHNRKYKGYQYRDTMLKLVRQGILERDYVGKSWIYSRKTALKWHDPFGRCAERSGGNIICTPRHIHKLDDAGDE